MSAPSSSQRGAAAAAASASGSSGGRPGAPTSTTSGATTQARTSSGASSSSNPSTATNANSPGRGSLTDQAVLEYLKSKGMGSAALELTEKSSFSLWSVLRIPVALSCALWMMLLISNCCALANPTVSLSLRWALNHRHPQIRTD